MFCKTKRVLENVWGSLSGGRVRDGPGYARIMVGSAPHWNCEFRLHFHNLHFQNLKEVSHESFVFTSSTFTFCCFVFDVVNFENWGSLAELLRPRQVQNLGRPRRISAFLMLSSSKWRKSRRIASFSSL